MRKTLILAAIAVNLATTIANAAPIVVRSGEHDSFTRLVLQLPRETDWKIDTDGLSSVLTLSSFDDGFDLSNAFSIIPRNRLRALVATNSDLELQLACNCIVQAFMEQDRYLVIDILNATAEDDERQTALIPLQPARLPDSSFSFGELLWATENPTQKEETRETTLETLDSETDSRPRSETAQIVGDTRRQLVQAFSRAASIGLVQAEIPESSEATLPTKNNSSSEIYDSSETLEIESDTSTQNIRITNSKDTPAFAQEDDIGLLGGSCPEPEKIDLAAWSTDESWAEQLARSNRFLYDEAGSLVEEYVIERARLYLSFGFGAEAEQTLGMIPSLSLRYPELMDLIQVMEHGYMPNPRILHRYADCNSDYALWGILSAERLPDSQAINPKAALRGLAKLPGHLKYFLAQELSDRLLHRGDLENAMIAIRSFERLPENELEKPKLVNATAERLRDNQEKAGEVLDSIVSLNTPEAPDALLSLIEKHVAENTPVTADIALLTETYAVELRNTPKGPDMLRAFVVTSAKSKQFDKAFETISTSDDIWTPSEKATLFSFVVAELTTTTDDMDFLKTYYQRVLGRESDLEASVAVPMIERLMDVGFVDAAIAAEQALPLGLNSEPAQVARARIHLAKSEYREGLNDLEGLVSPKATELRAIAQRHLGLNSAAVASFTAADLENEAKVASWLSDEWTELVTRDDPIFGQAVEIATEDTGKIEPNNEMIATSDAAIQASIKVREQLLKLLDEVRITD
ncbi:MAG: hypothetical protein V2I76_14005 [Roseobacter sp.]|jgi:hypothetical protein|nr:hypothetical protein [Roseobacter sp.]